MSHPAFAVICTTVIYCRDTDAIQGQGTFVYERHLTKRAAQDRCDKLNGGEDYDGECHFHVELRPYREGEDQMPVPRYSLLELHMDDWAKQENCPEWAQ